MIPNNFRKYANGSPYWFNSYSPSYEGISMDSGLILVVDDDKTNRIILTELLHHANYTVIQSSNAHDALDLISKKSFDLVLLDIIMPGKSGIEMLRDIRRSYTLTSLPVILVTAKSDSVDIIRGMENGANDYLTKPIDLATTLARVRTQIKLKRTSDELLQSQKLQALGRIAGGIAHEINTPTQYIGDNVRFLKDSFAGLLKLIQTFENYFIHSQTKPITDELRNEIRQAMEDADVTYLASEIPHAIIQTLEGINRVSQIVTSMKTFSHAGGGEKQAADLNKCIQDTITVATNEWKYVANMQTDFDQKIYPIPCFAGEFNQVILNLIVNAAHSIKEVVKPGEKGEIIVKTQLLGDLVEISIHDTGTGIPEDIQSRIFDPFFTTKDVNQGTGQGLAIAQAIIQKKHGGSIDFTTEIGKGSTFIVRIPIDVDLKCGDADFL